MPPMAFPEVRSRIMSLRIMFGRPLPILEGCGLSFNFPVKWPNSRFSLKKKNRESWCCSLTLVVIAEPMPDAVKGTLDGSTRHPTHTQESICVFLCSFTLCYVFLIGWYIYSIIPCLLAAIQVINGKVAQRILTMITHAPPSLRPRRLLLPLVQIASDAHPPYIKWWRIGEKTKTENAVQYAVSQPPVIAEAQCPIEPNQHDKKKPRNKPMYARPICVPDSHAVYIYAPQPLSTLSRTAPSWASRGRHRRSCGRTGLPCTPSHGALPRVEAP